MVPERCKLKQAMSLAVVLVVVASVLSIAPTGVAAQESTAETEPNNASVGGTPVTTEEVTGDITTTDGTAPSGTTVGGNTTGGSGTSGPGFGPTVAVVALLTGALLAVRRRTE